MEFLKARALQVPIHCFQQFYTCSPKLPAKVKKAGVFASLLNKGDSGTQFSDLTSHLLFQCQQGSLVISISNFGFERRLVDVIEAIEHLHRSRSCSLGQGYFCLNDTHVSRIDEVVQKQGGYQRKSQG